MTPAALDLLVRADFGSPRRLMGYAPPHYILSHHNHSHITRSMDLMGPSIGYWRTTSTAPHLTRGGRSRQLEALTFDCIYENLFFN